MTIFAKRLWFSTVGIIMIVLMLLVTIWFERDIDDEPFFFWID